MCWHTWGNIPGFCRIGGTGGICGAFLGGRVRFVRGPRGGGGGVMGIIAYSLIIIISRMSIMIIYMYIWIRYALVNHCPNLFCISMLDATS